MRFALFSLLCTLIVARRYKPPKDACTTGPGALCKQCNFLQFKNSECSTCNDGYAVEDGKCVRAYAKGELVSANGPNGWAAALVMNVNGDGNFDSRTFDLIVPNAAAYKSDPMLFNVPYSKINEITTALDIVKKQSVETDVGEYPFAESAMPFIKFGFIGVIFGIFGYGFGKYMSNKHDQTKFVELF